MAERFPRWSEVGESQIGPQASQHVRRRSRSKCSGLADSQQPGEGQRQADGLRAQYRCSKEVAQRPKSGVKDRRPSRGRARGLSPPWSIDMERHARSEWRVRGTESCGSLTSSKEHRGRRLRGCRGNARRGGQKAAALRFRPWLSFCLQRAKLFRVAKPTAARLATRLRVDDCKEAEERRDDVGERRTASGVVARSRREWLEWYCNRYRSGRGAALQSLTIQYLTRSELTRPQSL